MIDYMAEVWKANEAFIRERAPKVLEQSVDLINDGIDLLGGKDGSSLEERKRAYFEQAVEAYLHHVLMPCGYALYQNCMVGTLPAAFAQLRLAVEALVKAYSADERYPRLEGFAEKLSALERDPQRSSVRRQARELDGALGVGDGFILLWDRLSEEWIHAGGFARRLTQQLEEAGDLPMWALIGAGEYRDGDLRDLGELAAAVGVFRELLAATFKHERG